MFVCCGPRSLPGWVSESGSGAVALTHRAALPREVKAAASYRPIPLTEIAQICLAAGQPDISGHICPNVSGSMCARQLRTKLSKCVWQHVRQTIADNFVQICLADAGRRMSENLNNERSPNTIWSSRGADKFGQACQKLSGSTCCQTYLDNFVRNCLAHMLPDIFGQLCCNACNVSFKGS